MSKASKLVAIALMAVVVASGAGYWLFSPKPTSEIVNYTSAETSLEVNRTTPEQTLTTSTSSPTTTAAETTLWINVTATKPVSYYISLLKSAQTQPYVQLAWELQGLPDATNATAVAKITYLALNATNPEVKEAFELMMKGGTPDLLDYTYTVPRYNTEVQVLYWLACLNEFKADDTLALAIAMVHGLWVTMGDEQVREAVKKDTSDLLTFFRETNELQRQRGYYQLEDYPLEAKVTLAWTGNLTPIDGPVQLTRYREKKPGLGIYQWMMPRSRTLIKMREIVVSVGWDKDVRRTIANLEYYFYFDRGLTQSSHWEYTTGDKEILVDGQQVSNGYIHDMNWMLEHYLETGRGIGQCSVETSWINTLAKSVGISSDHFMNQFRSGDGTFYGHSHVVFFDPLTKSWIAYERQLEADVFTFREVPGSAVNMYVLRPPVRQQGYLKQWDQGRLWNGNSVHLQVVDVNDIVTEFTKGVPTSQMKQWLLYS
jgi:hypothetical protein